MEFDFDRACKLRQLAYDSVVLHKSVAEQRLEETNDVIDSHGLLFYLTVRQDVDRVVGGFTRNLQDIQKNVKLRQTFSLDHYSMDQRAFSSTSSTRELYSSRHLP